MAASADMTDFRVKFEGPPKYIDSQTLVNSLVHLSTALQEINREFRPTTRIEIKIKAVEPGSFWIDLAIFGSTVQDLFTRDNIQTGYHILASLASILLIRKHLAGEKPKEVTQQDNKIKVENLHGDVIVVEGSAYKIYEENKVIDKAITSTFETLEADNLVTGIEITDAEKKSLFGAKKEEFKCISNQPPREQTLQENEQKHTERANLHALKVVFEEKYKWEFYYKNHKITAKIDDKGFYGRINAGEKFGKGDVLVVELEIFQIRDPVANVFVNHSYRILQVIEHIPRERNQGQQEIGFD